MFLALVEHGLGIAVKSAGELVLGLTCTFDLMSLHDADVSKVAISGTPLVFISVRRQVRDV